jgi:hypothetical protein
MAKMFARNSAQHSYAISSLSVFLQLVLTCTSILKFPPIEIMNGFVQTERWTNLFKIFSVAREKLASAFIT